jgi:hypothetical protein
MPKCLVCGEEFQCKANAKTCSVVCRMKLYRQREKERIDKRLFTTEPNEAEEEEEFGDTFQWDEADAFGNYWFKGILVYGKTKDGKEVDRRREFPRLYWYDTQGIKHYYSEEKPEDYEDEEDD